MPSTLEGRVLTIRSPGKSPNSFSNSIVSIQSRKDPQVIRLHEQEPTEITNNRNKLTDSRHWSFQAEGERHPCFVSALDENSFDVSLFFMTSAPFTKIRHSSLSIY